MCLLLFLFSVAVSLAFSRPNKPASANRAMTVLFHIPHPQRPAGPRRARFVYGAPSEGIEVISSALKDYNTPCCGPRDGL